MADAAPPEKGPAADDLPSEVVDDLLSAPRRRHALVWLYRHGRPIPLSDLAAQVAAREHETAPDELPDAARERVQESIYQEHLPKLTATGVVNFNSMLGTVELAAAAEQFEDRLAALAEEG